MTHDSDITRLRVLPLRLGHLLHVPALPGGLVATPGQRHLGPGRQSEQGGVQGLEGGADVDICDIKYYEYFQRPLNSFTNHVKYFFIIRFILCKVILLYNKIYVNSRWGKGSRIWL